jgi:hypothetical protein
VHNLAQAANWRSLVKTSLYCNRVPSFKLIDLTKSPTFGPETVGSVVISECRYNRGRTKRRVLFKAGQPSVYLTLSANVPMFNPFLLCWVRPGAEI